MKHAHRYHRELSPILQDARLVPAFVPSRYAVYIRPGGLVARYIAFYLMVSV
jgi:hypothetical protein